MDSKETVVKNINKLCTQFVLKEIREGQQVPEEVTDYVLQAFAPHIERRETTIKDELDELFVERFIDFIHKHPAAPPTETQPRNINEQLIARFENVETAKYAEIKNALEALKKLNELKKLFQQKLENDVVVIELQAELLHIKNEMLRDKAQRSLINETPATCEAFKLLKNIVYEEKSSVDARLKVLEEQTKNYKLIEEDPQFKILLKQWMKLQQQKQLLAADEQDDMIKSFSHLTASGCK